MSGVFYVRDTPQRGWIGLEDRLGALRACDTGLAEESLAGGAAPLGPVQAGVSEPRARLGSEPSPSVLSVYPHTSPGAQELARSPFSSRAH